MALPWLLLPPAILLTASVIHPVYNFRYIVYCIPAAALLIGAALAVLGRYAGPVALVVIVLGGLPSQLAERARTGTMSASAAPRPPGRPAGAAGGRAAEHQRPDRTAEGHRGTHSRGAYPYGWPGCGTSARAPHHSSPPPWAHLRLRSCHPAAADPRHPALGRGMDHT